MSARPDQMRDEVRDLAFARAAKAEAERDRLRYALHKVAMESCGDTHLSMGRALGRVHQIARAALTSEEN